ncbi:hypothetical protein FFI97_005765 [Variovorax sp. KBS0712]|uniref:hypothetical protein n=1 Tax=Variovorax sp. KBS0712 TaxID=2578111 RepID=UPI00111BB789|nr:hypothetical protein [Variovorax sp. KBS0712]TSD59052.1 hypothetical protein FFI97_001600 [Variovorax sp. KBS0712]TSD59815.1 hypothetical protein FFI97_005765 [Variovorax sp. KBS0712]
MAKAKQLDALAERALDAVVASRPDLRTWAEDKRRELAGEPRSELLRFLVFSLDQGNQQAVEAAFGLAPGDLAVAGPAGRIARLLRA